VPFLFFQPLNHFLPPTKRFSFLLHPQAPALVGKYCSHRHAPLEKPLRTAMAAVHHPIFAHFLFVRFFETES